MTKYFGTDGIRGMVGSRKISPDFLMYVAYVASKILCNCTPKAEILQEFIAGDFDRRNHIHNQQMLFNKQTTLPVAIVGRDTRGSGEMLESAVITGLLAAGVQVIKLGVTTTPILALSTAKLPVNFGVMITASHNPFTDNGVKFFTSQGYKLDNATEDLIEQEVDKILVDPINALHIDSGMCTTSIKLPDGQGFNYAEYVRRNLDKNTDFSKLTVVFDGANGAGSVIGQKLLQSLGFAKIIVIGVTPDGKNINAACGSTNLKMLSQTVLENHADLGFALDGDGDRVIMIDELGHEIDGDKLLAILARELAEKHKIREVVVTKMSNYAFEEYLTKQLNLVVYRTDVGDRYVAEMMRDIHASLGGENSGHIMVGHDAVSGDGLMTALRVISCFARSHETSFAHFSDLFTLVPSILVNVEYNEEAIANPLENAEFKQVLAKKEEILKGNGRILIRKSGTQSLIRILVEGKDQQTIKEIAEELATKIKCLA